MKLELGKSYLTRDNKKVKIIKEGLLWPYTYLGDNAQSYTENGRRWYGDDEVKCIEDLIILWEEEQVETSKEKVNHPIHYNKHPSGVECITLLGMSAERELALLAEIDRLKAKLAKTEWQPIETAPMDGTRVLVTAGFMVFDAYFRRGDWWLYECGDDWYSVTINPTNWMPLPEPPTTEETK